MHCAGIDGVPIEVEVGLSSQLPRVDIVGLPEASVRARAAASRRASAARASVRAPPAAARFRTSSAMRSAPSSVGWR